MPPVRLWPVHVFMRSLSDPVAGRYRGIAVFPCQAGRKRLGLIKERIAQRKNDEKIINSKVLFLKDSTPPSLPTSGLDPAQAKEHRIPSPVLPSISTSESDNDDFQDDFKVLMTVYPAPFLSVLAEWFAGQAQHPAGVNRTSEGTVQALRQSANRGPSCTFWTGLSALGMSAIGDAFGVETALSSQNAGNTCLFFLEIRRDPHFDASPQETGSSQGQTP
jgi:hypothetical protein